MEPKEVGTTWGWNHPGMEPLGMEPLGMEPLEMELLGIEPLGIEPLGMGQGLKRWRRESIRHQQQQLLGCIRTSLEPHQKSMAEEDRCGSDPKGQPGPHRCSASGGEVNLADCVQRAEDAHTSTQKVAILVLLGSAGICSSCPLGSAAQHSNPNPNPPTNRRNLFQIQTTSQPPAHLSLTDPDPNPNPDHGPDPDPKANPDTGPAPDPGPNPYPNPDPDPGPDPNTNADPDPNPDPLILAWTSKAPQNMIKWRRDKPVKVGGAAADGGEESFQCARTRACALRRSHVTHLPHVGS